MKQLIIFFVGLLWSSILFGQVNLDSLAQVQKIAAIEQEIDSLQALLCPNLIASEQARRELAMLIKNKRYNLLRELETVYGRESYDFLLANYNYIIHYRDHFVLAGDLSQYYPSIRRQNIRDTILTALYEDGGFNTEKIIEVEYQPQLWNWVEDALALQIELFRRQEQHFKAGGESNAYFELALELYSVLQSAYDNEYIPYDFARRVYNAKDSFFMKKYELSSIWLYYNHFSDVFTKMDKKYDLSYFCGKYIDLKDYKMISYCIEPMFAYRNIWSYIIVGYDVRAMSCLSIKQHVDPFNFFIWSTTDLFHEKFNQYFPECVVFDDELNYPWISDEARSDDVCSDFKYDYYFSFLTQKLIIQPDLDWYHTHLDSLYQNKVVCYLLNHAKREIKENPLHLAHLNLFLAISLHQNPDLEQADCAQRQNSQWYKTIEAFLIEAIHIYQEQEHFIGWLYSTHTLAEKYDQQCKYEESALLRLRIAREILRKIDDKLLSDKILRALDDNIDKILKNRQYHDPSSMEIEALKELAAVVRSILHYLEEDAFYCKKTAYSHHLCLFDIIIESTNWQTGKVNTNLAERMTKDYLDRTKRQGNQAAHQALKEWLAEFYKNQGRGY